MPVPLGVPNVPRIKHRDPHTLYKRLMDIMARDIRWLQDATRNGPLDSKQSATVTAYLRLIKELKKVNKDDAKDLSEHDLEQIAKSES